MVLLIESAAVRFTRRQCPEAAHRQARNDLLRCRREQIDNVLLVHMTRNGRTHFLNRRRRARRARARDGSSSGRVFDPAIGRFLSADPYIDGPETTQGWNRYAYVHGRALSATDPSGFCVMNQASDTDPNVQRNWKHWANVGYGGLVGPAWGDPPSIGGRSSPGLLGNWNGCIPESALGYVAQYQANQGNIGVGSSAPPPVPATTSPPSGSQTSGGATGGGDRPQSQACIGAPKDCGGENFWRDNAAGSFLSSFADPLALFNDGVNPLSDVWLTPREQNDARFIGFLSLVTGGAGYATGFEAKLVANLRIAPFGNRTGHALGRYPHYHRRGVDAATGDTLPGQGIGRHRPWETKSPDTSFWDRF